MLLINHEALRNFSKSKNVGVCSTHHVSNNVELCVRIFTKKLAARGSKVIGIRNFNSLLLFGIGNVLLNFVLFIKHINCVMSFQLAIVM